MAFVLAGKHLNRLVLVIGLKKTSRAELFPTLKFACAVADGLQQLATIHVTFGCSKSPVDVAGKFHQWANGASN